MGDIPKACFRKYLESLCLETWYPPRGKEMRMQTETRGALVCACLILFGAPACQRASIQGNGVAKTELRDVAALGAIEAIELSGSIELEFTAGAPGKLSLTGDENLLPLISTTVSQGKLVVSQTKKMEAKTPLLVTLSAPGLRRVDVTGAANVHATGIQGPTFAVGVTGAANAELSGQVDVLELTIDGAGSVRANDLHAKEARVDLSGVGSADVNATDKLKANVSGVGTVRYRGTPTVEKDVSGLGAVTPL
jgi:hypothetical protein